MRGGGGVPMGSHARRAAEVADVFISLGRNENSAMTVGGGVLVFGLCSLLARGWIVPVGGSTPDRLKVGGSTSDRLKGLRWGEAPSRAWRDAFPSRAWERQDDDVGAAGLTRRVWRGAGNWFKMRGK